MKYFILMLIVSCTPVPSGQEPVKAKPHFYQDMDICVNEKCGTGLLVVEEDLVYDVRAEWGDYVSENIEVTSCKQTRHFSAKKGLFRRGQKKIAFEYKMHPDMKYEGEDVEHCPIYISALDKDGGHSFGSIYTRTIETLPAKILCNEVLLHSSGLSACQVKENTVVRLKFDAPVLFDQIPGCSEMEYVGEDHRIVEYLAAGGECVYGFLSLDSDRIHRHVAFGYRRVILRGK